MNRRRYRAWQRRHRIRNFRLQLALCLVAIVCACTYALRSGLLDDILTVGAILVCTGIGTSILAIPFIRPAVMFAAACFSFSGCYVLAIAVHWTPLFVAATCAVVLTAGLIIGALMTTIPAVSRISWALSLWSIASLVSLTHSFLRVRVTRLIEKFASLV